MCSEKTEKLLSPSSNLGQSTYYSDWKFPYLASYRSIRFRVNKPDPMSLNSLNITKREFPRIIGRWVILIVDTVFPYWNSVTKAEETMEPHSEQQELGLSYFSGKLTC
jgi:hypothetical protein